MSLKIHQPTNFAIDALVPSDTSARVLRQVVDACALILARAAGTFVCNNSNIHICVCVCVCVYKTDTPYIMMNIIIPQVYSVHEMVDYRQHQMRTDCDHSITVLQLRQFVFKLIISVLNERMTR